jgi:hypothetical protein
VIPDGDVAVMNRALTTLLAELSKRKFAATDRPRPGRARSAEAREPAAEVRRAVWKRDGGRCGWTALHGARPARVPDRGNDRTLVFFEKTHRFRSE